MSKCLFTFLTKKRKKDAHWHHFIHLIILFKFKMVDVFLIVIRKGISLEFRLSLIGERLRPGIKRDSRSNISRPGYHRRTTSVWLHCSIYRSDGRLNRYPTNRYFSSATGLVVGRPYLQLYRWAVSSWAKDKSSMASSFRRKCPLGSNLLLLPCAVSVALPFPC